MVLLKGQDVTTLPAFRRVRLGLGLTFQTNRAYHQLSVRQNLEIPIPPPGDDRAKHAQIAMPMHWKPSASTR